MLAFKTFKSLEEVNELQGAEKKCIENIQQELAQHSENFKESDIGFCCFEDFLILRLFDGGSYSFALKALQDAGGDYSYAVNAVREYAVKEEIGLIFSEVSYKDIGKIISEFNYAEACAESFDRNFYTVKVLSEADRCDVDLCLPNEPISLTPLFEDDIEEYARLCRDEEGLEFWGYDYRADEQEQGVQYTDRFFFDSQKAEFQRGTSVSFAARYEEAFAGEAVFYAFDYKGGAEISFRLLPEYRGRGLGRMLLEVILMAAEELSLSEIYATVNKNNLPSLNILSEYMDKEWERGDIVHFVLRSV